MPLAMHGRQRAGTTPDPYGSSMLPPRLLCIALVIALVGTIISMSAAAADATPPGAAEGAYDSPEAAFTAVFLTSGLAERGYQENREYAAAIYQLPDGRWYSTTAAPGSRTECAIPYHAVPPAAIRIVGAHTHGQAKIPEDSGHLYGLDFSQVDLRNAVRNYRVTHGRIAVQLLFTSELKILRLTISGQPESILGLVATAPTPEFRRVPGAVQGTTELLGQFPVPGSIAALQMAGPALVEARASRDASPALPANAPSPARD